MTSQHGPARRRARGRRRIAGERPGTTTPVREATPAEPTSERVGTPSGAGPGPRVAGPALRTRPERSEPADGIDGIDGTDGTDRGTRPERTGPRRPAPWWLLAALAVVAAALVVVAATGPYLRGVGLGDYRYVQHHDRVEAAGTAATAVAERAAATILAYDYRSLDADEKAAKRYMTPDYAQQYASTFDKLVRPHAGELHAHVTAEVKASGVTHADEDRVSVLLFVDQRTTSTANDGKPQTALNRVGMTLVRRDGRWLVDGIRSY